jgi:hypothetical protein
MVLRLDALPDPALLETIGTAVQASAIRGIGAS